MLLAITICYLGTLAFLAYTMTYFMMYGAVIRGIDRGCETLETVLESEEQPPIVHLHNNVHVSSAHSAPQGSRPVRDRSVLVEVATNVSFAIGKLVMESLGHQKLATAFEYVKGAGWSENIFGLIRRGIVLYIRPECYDQVPVRKAQPETPEATAAPSAPDTPSAPETTAAPETPSEPEPACDEYFDQEYESDQPISSVPTWGEFMNEDTCLSYLRMADQFDNTADSPGVPFDSMTPQEVYEEIAAFSDSEVKLCDIVNSQSNISRYLRLLVINHVGYARFQELLTTIDNELQERVYCSDSEDWNASQPNEDENRWSDMEEPTSSE